MPAIHPSPPNSSLKESQFDSEEDVPGPRDSGCVEVNHRAAVPPTPDVMQLHLTSKESL